MANAFKNTSQVVRDSAILLSDNLVAANLCNRRHEQQYASKVGATIEISSVASQTARDFVDDSSTVTDSDITENGVDLVLSEQPYISHTITSAQRSLELDDFNVVVTQPAILAIRDAIDTFILKQANRGYGRNVSGTAGVDPSTHAHILAGRKVMNDNSAPMADRIAIVNTTAAASLLDLDIFTSVDYGTERPSGLREASMGRMAGYDFYESQNVVDLARGDVGDATNVYGAGQALEALVNVDDGGATSTGTINAGSQFTISGLTNTYTVVSVSGAGVAAASGAFALTLDQDLESAPADNAAISWVASSTGNILYCKDSLLAAIVPPQELAIGSSTAFFDGVGIRYTASTATSTLSDQVVFDTYVGSVVQIEQAGAILQG